MHSYHVQNSTVCQYDDMCHSELTQYVDLLKIRLLKYKDDKDETRQRLVVICAVRLV